MKIVPPGYETPADALDALGRTNFGDAWTGEERKARSGLVSVDEYQSAASSSGSGHSGSAAGWGRPTGLDACGSGLSRSGRITIAPALAPREVRDFWPFGDPHDPTYQTEREARHRWEQVVEALLMLLAQGARRAISLDRSLSTPRRHELKPDFWLRSDAAKILEKGCVPANGHWRGEGELLIASLSRANPSAEAERGPLGADRPPLVQATPAPPSRVRWVKRQRAAEALAGLYPDGVPGALGDKELHIAVCRWLTDRGLPEVQKDTVLRAAGRRK